MVTAPEPLTENHGTASFDCGEESLNLWLQRKAWGNQGSGASKTYVICDGSQVIGYYCLATGAVRADEAIGSIRRNMPDPIPMMLLGRLAIDQNHQGRRFGRALLRDAVLRTLRAASIVGIRGIFVHALSDSAKKFYEEAGFRPSPAQPMLLMISLKEAEIAVGCV